MIHRPRHAVFASLLLALLLALPRPARAGGQFSKLELSPKNGLVVVGTASNRLVARNAASGQVLWQIRAADAAAASIAMLPDRILVSLAKRGHLYALNPDNGSIWWEHAAKGPYTAPPQMLGGHVLIPTRETLLALDAQTGQTAWEAQGAAAAVMAGPQDAVVAAFDAPTGGKKPSPQVVVKALAGADGHELWAAAPVPGKLKDAPQVVGDAVVFSTEAAPVRRIVALAAAGGRPPVEQDFNETDNPALELLPPCVVAVGRDRQVSVSGAADGKLRWRRALGAQPAPKGEDFSVGPLQDGVLYVTAKLLAEGANPPRVQVLALDAASGNELGRYEQAGTVETPLTYVADHLLLGLAQTQGARAPAVTASPAAATASPAAAATPEAAATPSKPVVEHILVALQAKTLQPAWTSKLKAGLGDAAPLSAGSLLLAQDDGTLRALDPATGQERWHDDLPQEIAAGPLAVDGVLVMGTGDQVLTAVDLTDGKTKWGKPFQFLGFTLNSGSTKLWFNEDKAGNLLFVLVISLLIAWYIYHARRGKHLYIRRIAGLAAIDEAVGRATEMGKPVLYVTGLADVDDIQTLASLSILGNVAKRTAEYETTLLVPCCRSVVMSTAQEVVKEAHFKAGRPDTYNRENIRYLTDDQFGFVAGVDGIMLRDRPAANFYMGMFYAESLILAETGHSTGAIQIAGTAAAAQLPFFVAACDYTLIGEELFAASAYLSQDPLQVGSLKGQDMAKAAIMIVILLSCLILPFYPGISELLFTPFHMLGLH